MKIQEIKEIALGMGIAAGKMKKSELVQAIQKKEGNEQCFDTGKVSHCGQYGCMWREDCR